MCAISDVKRQGNTCVDALTAVISHMELLNCNIQTNEIITCHTEIQTNVEMHANVRDILRPYS